MVLASKIKSSLYFNITGPDGSGKDSVIEKILESIDSENIVMHREPGGSKNAELIRRAILTIDENVRKEAFKEMESTRMHKESEAYIDIAYGHYTNSNYGMMEVYLYAAARNETNIDVIDKNLKVGKSIFGSRSVSCSMAYQGKARGLGMDFVWDVNRPVMNRLPDFEIFLDVPTEISLERLSNRTEKQDRLDLETAEFHRLSREGYLEFYSKGLFPAYIVDATGTVEENATKVLDILKKYSI